MGEHEHMTTNKKKYLVTGGSGFIGAALVHRLLKEGHHVKVLDDNSRGDTRRLAHVIDDVEFVQGDIRDRETVIWAIRGVDSVCHLAYVNGTEFFYSKPELVLDVAVKGMVNVLDGCIEHHVPELILASSSEVYQTPPTVPTDESVGLSVPDVLNPRYSYGGGKMICELMAINYGRKYFDRTLIFRPHNVYGPDMGWEHVLPQFILRMKSLSEHSENPVPFKIQGQGTETRSFIYIDDFTDGLMDVINLGENGHIYHIGTQEEVSIADLARYVGSYFNREIVVVPGELAKGGTPRRCPDITKLEALGFQPKFSLSEGLPHIADWYVQHEDLHPAHKKKTEVIQ